MARRMKLDNYAVPSAPRLGLRGWLRWIWRQVTSMRVALILLLLLGLASIPGSLLPQWPQDAAATQRFLDNNPTWGPVLESLGMLDVFGSAWFTAIYVLLFASLIGCIIPRVGVYWKALRQPPARAPHSLRRYAAQQRLERDSTPADAVAAARAALRPSSPLAAPFASFATRVDDRSGTLALAAEQGRGREAGNLLFHLALVGILLAAGAGSLLSFRGQAVLVEGETFTNAVVAYDSFESGRFFDAATLEPFTMRLDDFRAEFSLAGRPVDFSAHVTVTQEGVDAERDVLLNQPIGVEGTKVYLMGNGYAPVITVRDSTGAVAFSQAVPFLPQDNAYTSTGVVKVPDVTEGEQIGLRGTLLPTGVIDGDTALSLHPEATNPLLIVTAFTGDLGLDDGIPQNVYVLDESQLSPVRGDDGLPIALVLELGETADLPDGLGTITFGELPRFAAFDLRADPSLPWLLSASLLALAGITVSPFSPRRRLWMTAEPQGTRTVVTIAAYGPDGDDEADAAAVAALAAALEEDS